MTIDCMLGMIVFGPQTLEETALAIDKLRQAAGVLEQLYAERRKRALKDDAPAVLSQEQSALNGALADAKPPRKRSRGRPRQTTNGAADRPLPLGETASADPVP